MRDDGGADRQQGSDGRSVADMDEDELHTVVRDAVEDAVLGVIGTLLLVGIGFVLAATGGATLFESSGVGSATVGAILLVSGLSLAAAALK